MRRIRRRSHRQAAASVFLAFAAGAAVPPAARADTFNWIGTSNGNWSDSANWQGGTIPIAGNDAYVRFGGSGTTQYNASQDLGNPFPLWILELNSSSTAQQTLSGNPIEFVNNPAAVSPVSPMPVLAQRFSVPATSGGWNLQNDLVLTNDTLFGNQAA